MKNMDMIFNPNAVAVIGASNRKGSVGYGLFYNLILNFKGRVYPVNPNHEFIQGFRSYPSIRDIKEDIDLAIVAIPAGMVPQAVKECGKSGVKGCIVVSSGFKETGKSGKRLEKEIEATIKKYDMTLIGPNCLGVINTSNKMNASFSSHMPNKGKTTILSQSGALGSAIIEWSLEQNVGIRAFVSVGSMLDVDFADLLGYFEMDDMTNSIIIYMESVKNARKFLEAGKKCVKKKPIIVLKAGSSDAGRKAAISHTGSLAGNNDIYQAAYRQAGILQITEISDVFTCLRTMCSRRLPAGSNLAIVTNAGGAGVMAVDSIEKFGGKITQLSKSTINLLNHKMPSEWSHGNPVDILGDASADRYRTAVRACLEDENVDGILVIFTQQYSSDLEGTAHAISELGNEYNKPLLCSRIGPTGTDKANEILAKNNIPNYPTPERAIRAFVNMDNYRKNLEFLKEPYRKDELKISPDKKKIKKMIANKDILSEFHSKQILKEYGIPVIETLLAKTQEDAGKKAKRIGFPVVLKLQSPDIIHKTDAGGVLKNIHSKEEAIEGFKKIIKNARKHNGKAFIEGVTVQKMIESIDYELILGSLTDSDFGPAILFGHGGVDVDIHKDKSIGLPPLTKSLARRVMENTRIFSAFSTNHRNRVVANIPMLEDILVRFSRLVMDFPEFQEIDINPIAINNGRPIVLDARIILNRRKDAGI